MSDDLFDVAEETFLVALERVHRLEYWLRRTLDYVERSGTDVERRLWELFFRVAEKTKNDDLKEAHELLRRHNEAGRDKLSEEAAKVVIRSSVRSSFQIARSHWYLQYFIVRTPVPRAVVGLMEETVDSIRTKTSISFEPIVAQCDGYMWEYEPIQTEITKEIMKVQAETIGKSRLVALSLPKIEMYGPAMWVGLFHELGHGIAMERKLVQEILKSVPGVQTTRGYEIRENWVSELVADQIALRIIGPAYIAFLVSFFMTYQDFLSTETHPAPAARIEALQSVIGKLSPPAIFRDGVVKPSLRYWEVREHLRQVTDLFPSQAKPNAEVERAVAEVRKSVDLPSVGEVIWQRVKDLDIDLRLDESACMKLLGELEKGLPIGSYIEDAEGLLKTVQGFDPKSIDTAELNRIYSLYHERPSSAAEVLNTAWLHRLGTWKKTVLADLYQGKDALAEGDNSPYKRFARRMSALDGLLVRSVETAHYQAEFDLALRSAKGP